MLRAESSGLSPESLYGSGYLSTAEYFQEIADEYREEHGDEDINFIGFHFTDYLDGSVFRRKSV